MGTRHLISVVKNNEYKIAQYGQWDGYPQGQGLFILQFLRDEFNKKLFEEKLSKISFANKNDLRQMVINAGIDPDKQYMSFEENNTCTKLYPEISRETGYKILSIIQNTDKLLKIVNDLDFVADSLFCEFAYVIDLDKNTFEIYEGFNKIPLNKNERFYFLQKENMEYYPVRNIITYRLDKLPSEETFLNYFEEIEENEEDF